MVGECCDTRTRMAKPKPTSQNKKVLPKEANDQQQQAGGGWLDSDRLSGHGADSAMAHLRERESAKAHLREPAKVRIDKAERGDS